MQTTQEQVGPWRRLPMKVSPVASRYRDRDKEVRVGILACRTPHRPNPIGLSLAKVEEIDFRAGTVTLGGLDVIDGTPCFDLKPYLPTYESIPEAIVPQWVRQSYEEPLMPVAWSPVSRAQFDDLADSGKLPV